MFSFKGIHFFVFPRFIIKNKNNRKINIKLLIKHPPPLPICGPGSSVGIATAYGLDGPGSNPGGGEILRTRPDRPWGPPSLLYNGYRVLPGGKERPGRDADPSPLLVPLVKKE